MTAIDDATNYMNARFGPQYTAWLALSSDDKGRTLVSATDFMNEQQWQGTATHLLNGNPTTLEWPRSGVFIDGVEIDSLTIPEAITQATFELAALLVADPDIPQNLDAGSNVQSLGAGPAKIAFFRPTSARDGTATRLPPMINRLVGRYLASSIPTSLGFSSGVNARSNFLAGRTSCTCNATPCCCAEQRPDLGWPV